MSNPPAPRGTSTPAWRWSIPALVLVALALGWPLLNLVSFAADGAVVSNVLREPVIWQRLGASTTQALLSAVVSLLLGLPVAWVLTRLRFRGHGAMRLFATLPLVLPTVVVALAVQELVGPTGWLNLALGQFGLAPLEVVGTLWAIVAAHAVFGVAIVVWVVSDAWVRLDPREVEAARVLGASPRQAFRHIAVPALAPAVGAAAALVFVFSFTSFAVVVLLGAPGLDTLEVTIYRLSTRPDLWPAAAVIALLQLVMTVAALTTRASLRPRLLAHPVAGAARAPASTADRFAIVLAGALVLALVGLPLAGVVTGALLQEGAFSTANFEALVAAPATGAPAPIGALGWSVAFAIGAAVLALLAGGTAAYATARMQGGLGAVLTALVWSPFAMPAVGLGFAYTVTANNELFDLRGSPLLLLAAHAVIAYPFVLRAVLPAANAVDPRLSEAAAVLGAHPRSAWRHITLPTLRPALVAGGVFAFVVSLGEAGATLLLRRPEFTTAPAAVFDALSRPGGTGVALALASILITVCVVAFVIIGRFRRPVAEG